jgi:hypothetical protein
MFSTHVSNIQKALKESLTTWKQQLLNSDEMAHEIDCAEQKQITSGVSRP